ncbi:hypothetical protein SAY87_014819 [Trapa incisa]|uniref:Copper transport protein n=2 Tax=Trapa TaxID=22665 RepID=A0AAN7MCZ2_TRANT|nr:hypothetical protein SAY87_014819 [Trapa incisa]KAK4802844.1 hypothetical protein SAY86_001047 [Trapa natans]
MAPKNNATAWSMWWARGGGSSNATVVIHHRPGVPIYTSLFWGHTAEVLFKGWPGDDRGMYALAVIFVFFLAVLVEFLAHAELFGPGASKVAGGLFSTGIYTVRTGVSYMVMLAVMSFNGGIFLAAVGGHAVGYLLFGSRIFKKPTATGGASPRKESFSGL